MVSIHFDKVVLCCLFDVAITESLKTTVTEVPR
jgi:hypothetical protein